MNLWVKEITPEIEQQIRDAWDKHEEIVLGYGGEQPNDTDTYIAFEWSEIDGDGVWLYQDLGAVYDHGPEDVEEVLWQLKWRIDEKADW